MSPERESTHRHGGGNLREFIAWLATVSPDDLRRWLADAYWKDQLEDTEIKRFFLLSLKGIDMRSKAEQRQMRVEHTP